MNHIDLKNKTVFVTGSAGFIGSNLVLELLRTQSPIHIIGLDNMNNYYDVNIKKWRLKEIEKCVAEHNDSTYVFYKDDLANKAIIDKIFAEHKPDIVVNLGAQAGVPVTFADTSALEKDYRFKPDTSLRTGLRHFAEWYKEFYNV